MSLSRMFSLLAISSVMIAGTALAQSAGAGGSTAAEGVLKANEKQAEVAGQADAQAQARAEEQKLEEIKEKGAKVATKTRAKADAKLEAAARKVDEEAQRKGDAKIASQLAAEFGTTSDAMIEERDRLEATWGELMIAHTLDANTKAEVDVRQLVTLKHKSVGWGQIAAGLGLRLGDVVSAVETEARVASGLAKADGKVAVIHGEGARAGVGVGAGVGVKTGGTNVGAGVTSGVGVKIGN